MAGLDILKQAGNSIIGNIAKATLKIEDSRVREIKVIESGTKSSMLYNETMGILGSTLNKNINEFKEKKMKELESVLTSEYKTYTVKFNPSELTINAVGGGRVAKTNFDGSASKVEYAAMDVNIQLMVKLIFDDMDIADSFMEEKINPLKAPINIGKDVYKTVKGKRNSVQAQVEGFIAALRNNYTRRVEFNWGKLTYKGVLNYMNAEYTMFSIHGRPVRAHVDIGILCSDADINSQTMGQWKSKYEKAFKDSDSTNLESTGQKLGNLLNINL